MKWFNTLIIFTALVFGSCGDDEPNREFELTISSDRGSNELYYILNEKSLHVYRITPDSLKNDTASIFQSVLNSTDTLSLIALLDVKSFSCKEQHALDARTVRFKNDSVDVLVDPNINHPKELDFAVRLINSIVSEELRLQFIDMQSAIEPTGKHSM